MTGNIFEIKRFAVHDGDGIRTTVFFKGCPLRCVWCHNPEGLSPKPQIAYYRHKCIGCGACDREDFQVEECLGEARVLYGREITLEALLPMLLEDKDFYEASGGGVTLSGGECLMQADFCAEVLKEVKKNGIHTAVDTCGFVSKEAFCKVIPYTDVFLYDLKAYDAEVHEKCTGQPNAIILENLLYLNSLGKDVEIRIPYVPGYNTDQMQKLAHFLAGLKCIKKIRILAYHNYAGSKYAALHMANTLPSILPTEEALAAARDLMEKITNVSVLS